MARRSRDGIFDDMLAIALRLPWPVSLGIALVGYLVLHSIASTPVPQATSTVDISRVASGQFVRTIAGIFQWLVPLVFVLGAAGSWWKQRKAVALVDTVAASTSTNALGEMSWREFEELVGEAFRRQGYTVTRVGGDGPDGGVDLVLTRGSEKTLVQCKQWRAQSVGVSIVRELFGVMAAKRAAAGIVVTMGSFTLDAVEFAKGRNVQLIDGDALDRMIAVKREPVIPASVVPTVAPRSGDPLIACPRCGARMVRREAKRGATAGQPFWGCSQFPTCKGTKTIR